MFLQLGSRRFDVTERPVVVGVLNRTRDSFFDRGAYYELDRLLARAEQLVADGADVLEVGARPGGVGVADVPPDEERDLAAGTLAELRSRFDVPLAVDTTRATVAEAAFAEGTVLGNDMSGFLDPGYLPAAAAAGAAVVATHIRRPPRCPRPRPALRRPPRRGVSVAQGTRPGRRSSRHRPRAHRRRPRDRPGQILAAVAAAADPPRRRHHARAASSAGRLQQDFLRRTLDLGDAPLDVATAAACALGAMRGGSVVRVHDARIGRQAADFAYALRAARS